MVNSGSMGKLEPDVIELTSVAERSTERLIRLINDLLDVAVTELSAIVQFERGEGGEVAAAVARQHRTTVHSARLEAVLNSFGVSVAGV